MNNENENTKKNGTGYEGKKRKEIYTTSEHPPTEKAKRRMILTGVLMQRDITRLDGYVHAQKIFTKDGRIHRGGGKTNIVIIRLHSKHSNTTTRSKTREKKNTTQLYISFMRSCVQCNGWLLP